MKILSILSSGYEQGGAEQSVVSYTKALRQMGHTVQTISSDSHPELQHFSDYEFKAIPTRGIKSLLYTLYNPSAYMVTKKVLRDVQPDVVLLNTMQQVSPSVLFALRKYRTIQCVHGPEAFTTSLLAWHMNPSHFKAADYDLHNLTWGGKLRYFLLKYVYVPVYKLGFKNIDMFLAFSSYTKDLLIQDGFAKKPIACIPIGMQLPHVPKGVKRDAATIVYVGRMEKVKGVMDLIDAMPAVLRAVPRARLELAGDGTYLPELTARAQQLGVEGSVVFRGHVSQEDVARLFRKATVATMPSTWPETFGKVGIEAMGLGAPVVASDVGGVRDWLQDGHNGILVAPSNPSQLADAIVRILTNPKLHTTMSKHARDAAATYTTDSFAHNLLRVMQEPAR